MRHRKTGRQLNRSVSHRKAMFRNMVTSLLKYDRIKTTDAKARELIKLADHLITLGLRGDLHARRQALAIIREKPVVHKLFADIPERMGNIKGGYTRIIKLVRRPGDATFMALVEINYQSEAMQEPAKEKKLDKSEPEKEVSPEDD